MEQWINKKNVLGTYGKLPEKGFGETSQLKKTPKKEIVNLEFWFKTLYRY